MKGYKLHVTGFDWDGKIGTIKDKNGKPIYNIDIDNLVGGNNAVSSKILAVDKIDLSVKKHVSKAMSQNDRQGNVYTFDLDFSVNVGDKTETVTRIRLNDEQARELNDLLDNRYKESQ